MRREGGRNYVSEKHAKKETRTARADVEDEATLCSVDGRSLCARRTQPLCGVVGFLHSLRERLLGVSVQLSADSFRSVFPLPLWVVRPIVFYCHDLMVFPAYAWHGVYAPHHIR